ncbi:MAG: hypothetical protein EA374_08530 [Acholeplasmatales bacterium]|nr:MAG: hypothetical protein EA374_08530 [Acholeplasmatales bacterium]
MLHTNIFFNTEGEVVHSSHYPSNGVLYQDAYEVLYTLDDAIHWTTRYHDGMFLDTFTIKVLEDYIEHESYTFHAVLSGHGLRHLGTVYHHESHYYTITGQTDDLSIINVFDERGNRLDTFVEGQDLFYLEGRFIVLNQETLDTEAGTLVRDTLTLLHDEQFSQYRVVRQPGLTPYILALWLLTIYMLPKTLFKVKQRV